MSCISNVKSVLSIMLWDIKMYEKPNFSNISSLWCTTMKDFKLSICFVLAQKLSKLTLWLYRILLCVEGIVRHTTLCAWWSQSADFPSIHTHLTMLWALWLETLQLINSATVQFDNLN